jgi:peptide-methionine (S)-S-oxide reductase
LDFGRGSTGGEEFMGTYDKKTERAAFGMGCFWQSEEVFRHLKGVQNTIVGYMGGTLKNPTYEDVCTGKTGHAEVVCVEYNPAEITYEKLLDAFWEGHDPTQVGKQGPDVGVQYRSTIFYFTPEQKAMAEKSKETLAQSGKYKNSIATEIAQASEFYRAEEYHQQYLERV